MPNQPKKSSKGRIPDRLQVWIDARKRHHLSHAHMQMARELGMNPAKLGKLDTHRQQPWKAPLPIFIEELYLKRFGKERPDVVLSIEEVARKQEEKKAAKREKKRLRREVTEQQRLAELESRGLVTLARQAERNGFQGPAFPSRGKSAAEMVSEDRETEMRLNQFPAGWDEQTVREIVDYYETQTDEEAAAEHEAARP